MANDAFLSALEQVLEHDANAEWIGANSPLAAPYFLGHALQATDTSAQARGNALRRLSREAAQVLSEAHQRLLDVSFFKRDWHININGVVERLGTSRSAYYRNRADALQALAHVLSQLVLPALRFERPIAKPIIGRANELLQSLNALRAGECIALIGSSGVGKTALGAMIAHEWSRKTVRVSEDHTGLQVDEHVFWFTIRSPLNDQLSSFVFALAHFLRTLGAAGTWRQLVADQGQVTARHVLGLLRHDLALLDARPLLCIDEVDQLRHELTEHAQILRLLEDLRALVPVMMIGQQLVIPTPRFLQLAGLQVEEVSALMAQLNIGPLSDTDLERLSQATRGNPALVHLFAALAAISDDPRAALSQIEATPSMELLLLRMWSYLNDDERELIAALSVYRSVAPRDAWQPHEHILHSLLQRELIYADRNGGIWVPEYVREFVHAHVPADVRPGLHLEAAQVFEARGDYTSAAYHYVQGRQPELAVWTWFNHRERETEQGRASAARNVFRDVTYAELPNEDDRRALALLRAEWHRFAGAAEEGHRALDAVSWPQDHPATVYSHRLRSRFFEMQGRLDETLASYRAGRDAFVESQNLSVVRLFVSAGYTHFRQRDMAQARQSAIEAQIVAENFRGSIEMHSNRYEAARQHYEAALELARESEHTPEGLYAEVLGYLGALEWQTGNVAIAIEHLRAALSKYDKAGNALQVQYQRMNLAAAHIVNQQYALALDEATTGLAVAESLNHAYLIAGLSVNAAEASLRLGQLDEAWRYCQQSLQQEESPTQTYAMTVMGMVEQMRGNQGHADSAFRQAIEFAKMIEDRYAEANAWRELGKLLRSLGKTEEGQAALDRAVALFSDIGLTNEVEKTLIQNGSPGFAH